MLEVYQPGRWLRISQPNSQARLRLFCFPYAGGTASIYRLWHQHLPADIEVCRVQLPGRENRISEVPFTNVQMLAQALVPVLEPFLDKPFAFFGHSMGTLIAYELTQQLWQQTGQLPGCLFVSGRRAPNLPAADPPLHSLNRDDEFLAELQQRYNQIPQFVLEDAEMRELFLPMLRADLTMAETYLYLERPELACPIVAFTGESDHHAPRTDMKAWQGLTKDSFNFHMLPGGHFYLNEQVRPLLEILSSYLLRVVSGGPITR